MERSSPSVAPVRDNQWDTSLTSRRSAPHSDYINHLLTRRDYDPIYHMFDGYYDDEDDIPTEVLVRRIMLVTEPPKGIENSVSRFDDLPDEERKKMERPYQVAGFLWLARMGFRTELGIDDDFTWYMLDNLPQRPCDRLSRILDRQRSRTSRDVPHRNEAPDAPSASSTLVDEAPDAPDAD